MTPDLKAAAARMSAAQIHRGPDGAGEFCDEQIALASRRLSIIDRAHGWQPLYNEDESLTLVINGEIYNFVELRAQLETRGHRFRTETDGEVILHLYEENPADFVQHLRGMFAFALWDKRLRRLILARDRMGEKPLYLFERDNELLFASEFKALLKSGLVPFKLDPRAVNLYFHYQYVPEPLTAVENVRKLDAGQMLIVDAATWRVETKTYWRMTDAEPLDGEPADLIREKLAEVSRLIVRSDVPVGVALSGGLDSSVVAALAATEKSDLTAFSVGYANRPESDERADAEAFAKHLKIPFFSVELDTAAIVEFFPELNFWRDDPIADIAGFGYYAVMKLAREHNVPVVLQGQGGDELFWGYEQTREAVRATLKKRKLRQNPRFQSLRQTLALKRPRNGLSAWLRDFGGIRSNRRDVKQQLAQPDRLSFYDKNDDFKSAAAQLPSLYNSQFAAQIAEADVYESFNVAGDWEFVETTLTALVCATYLRENGMAQGDRLAMASSIEMRLPLVDHQFVETIIGLRKANSDAGLPPKHWLKAAVKDIVPEWVTNRPKRGFAPPTRDWHDAIFAAHGDTLRDGYLVQSGILSDAAGANLARGEFPAAAVCPLSFKALVLEQWCRQMLNV